MSHFCDLSYSKALHEMSLLSPANNTMRLCVRVHTMMSLVSSRLMHINMTGLMVYRHSLSDQMYHELRARHRQHIVLLESKASPLQRVLCIDCSCKGHSMSRPLFHSAALELFVKAVVLKFRGKIALQGLRPLIMTVKLCFCLCQQAWANMTVQSSGQFSGSGLRI